MNEEDKLIQRLVGAFGITPKPGDIAVFKEDFEHNPAMVTADPSRIVGIVKLEEYKKQGIEFEWETYTINALPKPSEDLPMLLFNDHLYSYRYTYHIAKDFFKERLSVDIGYDTRNNITTMFFKINEKYAIQLAEMVYGELKRDGDAIIFKKEKWYFKDGKVEIEEELETGVAKYLIFNKIFKKQQETGNLLAI